MKLLVFSYFANMDGMACSHHIDDRLGVLKDQGAGVTLLSTIFVGKSDRARHLRVPSLSGSGLRFEVRQYLKRDKRPRWVSKTLETVILLPVFPFYFVEKLLFNVDTTWLWFPLAFWRGLFHCLRHRPDFIYSTGGPISAHLAAALTSRCTGITWVSEFQDPLLHSYCARSSLERRLTEWAERIICQKASKVVFLTERARAIAAARTELGDRGAVIYPGATPVADYADYQPQESLSFVHFGSLGGCRNLVSFLKALCLVFEEQPELSKTIRLTLYGNFGSDIANDLASFPYPWAIEAKGLVPRQQSTGVMQKSDILLLVQGIDDVSRETIPSKAYEYFHAQRPVLGLLYRNEELRNMMLGLGHLPVEADDVTQIKDGILSMAQKWRSGETVQVRQSPFTVTAAVEKLLVLAS